MKNVYDYNELIAELKEELNENILTRKSNIQILRSEEVIYDDYKPVVDWYYDATIMKDNFSNTRDKNLIEIEKNYLSDLPNLEIVTISAVIDEMETHNNIDKNQIIDVELYPKTIKNYKILKVELNNEVILEPVNEFKNAYICLMEKILNDNSDNKEKFIKLKTNSDFKNAFNLSNSSSIPCKLNNDEKLKINVHGSSEKLCSNLLLFAKELSFDTNKIKLYGKKK